MTGKVLSRHMIICDGGCGTTFGEDGRFPNAHASRTAAKAAGWTLVPKIKANGKPVQIPNDLGRLNNICDVCPACTPTFIAPRIEGTGRPAWFKEEIARLRAENDELKRRTGQY